MKLIYFVFLFLISCRDPKLVGLNGKSESIDESKRREVFMMQYVLAKNPIMINNKFAVRVDEVWLEKSWSMKSFIWETVLQDQTEGYQLIISSKDCQLQDYGHNNNWYIENDFTVSFRKMDANGCYLITDLDSLPKTDTIKYLIKKGESSKNNRNIIGELKLIKVQ